MSTDSSHLNMRWAIAPALGRRQGESGFSGVTPTSMLASFDYAGAAHSPK